MTPSGTRYCTPACAMRAQGSWSCSVHSTSVVAFEVSSAAASLMRSSLGDVSWSSGMSILDVILDRELESLRESDVSLYKVRTFGRDVAGPTRACARAQGVLPAGRPTARGGRPAAGC